MAILTKRRTADATAPVAGDLSVGELALNLSTNNSVLYTKDAAGNVVQLTPLFDGTSYSFSVGIDNTVIGANTAAAVNATTLGVAGVTTLSDRLVLSGVDVAIPSASTAEYGGSSTNGAVIIGSGGTYDFVVKQKGGSNIMQAPTGTQNIEFLGNATFNGNLGVGGAGFSVSTLNVSGGIVTDTGASDGYGFERAGVEQLVLQLGATGADELSLINPLGNDLKLGTNGNVHQTIDSSGNVTFSGAVLVDGSFPGHPSGLSRGTIFWDATGGFVLSGDEGSSGDTHRFTNKTGATTLSLTNSGDATFSGNVTISNTNDRPSLIFKDSSGNTRSEIYIGDTAAGDADEDATYIDTKSESLQILGGLGVTGDVAVGSATGQNTVFNLAVGTAGGANHGTVIVGDVGWLGFNDGNDANIPAYINYTHSTNTMFFQADSQTWLSSTDGDATFSGSVAIEGSGSNLTVENGPSVMEVDSTTATALKVKQLNSGMTGDVFQVHCARSSTTAFDLIQAGTSGGSTSVFKVIGNGNVVNTNNSYGPISDVSLKQDIVDAGSSWDDVKAYGDIMRKFRFIADVEENGDNATVQLGWVAQELEEVSPGLVYETNLDGETKKVVKASVAYMKNVKATSELIYAVEALQSENADLKARLEALEAK